MKKEIKGILDFTENADYKRLSIDEIIVIKDYIINLQESEAYYYGQYKELQEENKRLNNIVNSDFAQISKEKMIDKLSATEMIVLQEKEIKRLNNIIDELEKFINSQKNWWVNLDDKLMEKPYIFVKYLRNKLKELKEGKKQC